jgi:hypothetical protein
MASTKQRSKSAEDTKVCDYSLYTPPPSLSLAIRYDADS